MRLIDATKVERKVEQFLQYRYEDYGTMFGPGLEILNIIRNAPTIAPPPNAPLTLDELREMDGEPAYIIFSDGHQGWAILDIWANANDSCVTLHGPDMESYEEQRLDFLNSYGEGPAGYDGWSAYRRKPEEETK